MEILYLIVLKTVRLGVSVQWAQNLYFISSFRSCSRELRMRDDLQMHVDFQLMIGFEPKLTRVDTFYQGSTAAGT